MESQFKHILTNTEFIFQDQVYKKTSFNRGMYYKDGQPVFKNFKKNTLILVKDDNNV